MPSPNTFSIKPIRELIEDVIIKKKIEMGDSQELMVIDPFVRNSIFKEDCSLTNDLDPEIEADEHMDALDFLKGIPSGVADIVFKDEPFTLRQLVECYKKMGMSVTQQTTQASYWTKIKREIARITKVGGIAMSFGYQSAGIGKNNGYEIERILLVAHGGPHYDTITTVDRKIKY